MTEDWLFKDVMAAIPTCVGIVWGISDEGLVFGCTISSLVSSSIMQNHEEIMFLLKKDSRTGAEIQRSKNFNVAILGKDQSDIAKLFSNSLTFDQKNYAITQPSWSGNAVSEFSVQLVQCYERGASTIYVSKVLGVRHSAEKEPLIYFNREFTQIAK